MIGVAILGGGFMGAAHAGNYAQLGDRVRVKWVCSRPSERAAKVADSLDAALTPEIDDVLQDPEVDVVDVCLPTPLHRDVTERAFAAEKHVFLEKPIALRLEDADAIIAAAERSGKLFMVGLVLRFWPEYVELARRVAAGEIGRPRAVSTHRLSPPADWNDWMADASKSGGVPVDLLVHDFDQMNRLLGTPRSVFAREPAPAHVIASVEYDGAEGVAEGSMQMPRSFPFSSSIRVLGERGAADYTFRAAPTEDGGNIGAVDPTARGLRIYSADGAPETIELESVDPWGPEIHYFVECVEGSHPPEQGTGAQARAALVVALAANRSIRSGTPEPV
jgi:predicted dehydrogenase